MSMPSRPPIHSENAGFRHATPPFIRESTTPRRVLCLFNSRLSGRTPGCRSRKAYKPEQWHTDSSIRQHYHSAYERMTGLGYAARPVKRQQLGDCVEKVEGRNFPAPVRGNRILSRRLLNEPFSTEVFRVRKFPGLRNGRLFQHNRA